MKIGRLYLILSLLATASAAAAPNTPIKIGYNPNLWFFHPTLIAERGLDKEEGLEVIPVLYPSPPTAVQAFAAGQVDVIYTNIASPLPLFEKGVAVRAVAATVHNGIFLIGKPPLLELGKKLGPVKAIEAFARQYGRKVKISALAKGTLSDLVTTYWLTKSFRDWTQYVEKINVGMQDQFQQSIFSPDIDASSVWAELLEVSRLKDPRLGLFARPQDLMPEQPGGILLVRESWVREKPELVQKLVNIQVRANEIIHRDPARAARGYQKYIGRGLVDPAVITRVLAQTPEQFLDDPRPLIKPSQIIADFMLQLGYLKEPRRLEEVIDARFYERAVAKK